MNLASEHYVGIYFEIYLNKIVSTFAKLQKNLKEEPEIDVKTLTNSQSKGFKEEYSINFNIFVEISIIFHFF